MVGDGWLRVVSVELPARNRHNVSMWRTSNSMGEAPIQLDCVDRLYLRA